MTSFLARVITPPSSIGPALQPMRVTVRDGRFESVLPVSVAVDELDELPYLAPGLFDLQVNGFRGIWFSSESLTVHQVEEVILDYVAAGITGCLPTLITSSTAAIEHGLRTIRAAMERSQVVQQMIAGCHIEGPFISPLDGPRGAHPARHVRGCDIAEVQRWQLASDGLVKLITLAPEVCGAEELIRWCTSQGIRVAIGHTAAGAQQIAMAISAGAVLGTHLGNGCASVVPRHDNPFWPQLADDRLTCSVIADGWHVPPEMLRCVVRCKSPSRTILTSDVSGFGGCAPGLYEHDDLCVEVQPGRRVAVADNPQFLAGSGVLAGDCVAHMVSLGIMNIADACHSASGVPLSLLGLPAGQIEAGAPATATVFRLQQSDDGDESLQFVPEVTWLNGVEFKAAR